MNYTVLLFFLFCNSFFGTFMIPGAVTTPCLILCAFYGAKNKTMYKNSFVLMGVGLVCMLMSCWIYRGQTPIDTVRAMPAYFGILFYFFLKRQNVGLHSAEKILVFLIWTFDIMYIAQYYLIGYGINFMNIDEWMFSDEEGGNRLRAMSSGLYSLGIFYGLTNYYITRDRKYLPFIVLGVFIMFLAGYRQLFASLGLAVLFMLYRFKRLFSARTLVLAVLLVVLFNIMLYIPDVQDKIAGMYARSDAGNTLDNEDYIRVVQFEYFENSFFHDIWERIFGAGIPLGSSVYGKFWAPINASGIQFVDWGLIGASWMLGTITVLGMIHYSCKAISVKVPSRYMYVCLWFIFLLSSAITNWEFCRNGNFLVQALALYIVELASLEYEKSRFFK